ncbi:MAG TPA: hypothetical protein VLG50_06540 [Candidatus Saccharimonadales bacterium]|nr:hypothetical protein [Candidatus Saccharimonadales bacterium]
MEQYVINPISGRQIKVGGDLYHKLVKNGTITSVTTSLPMSVSKSVTAARYNKTKKTTFKIPEDVLYEDGVPYIPLP